MKTDGNLSVHQRTSRFRSDVEIESLQFTPNMLKGLK
ncbi:hypothetical protein T01_10373 [Trichinella spiralis]|uniref:Uncharacterized protein n=1 Tax=Trichinella spiralis TaxID=6334 RepID=A0A0V1AGV2_TRISP|nr:hypothetical protein T01_10373 [Trichinella spiralis]